MGCVPGTRYVAEQVPLPMLTVPQPVIVVPPSVKAIVPVGAPLPGEVTLTDAVYVTGCPTNAEVADDTSAVVVAAATTDCVSESLLVAKLMSLE